MAYLGCGLATLWRATVRDGRLPWVLLGSGLVLYATGSIYFNLAFGTDPSPPFPSPADGLWLSLYPLTFAALAILVRRRYNDVGITRWLDGLIGGTVVAAFAAAVVFEPLESSISDTLSPNCGMRCFFTSASTASPAATSDPPTKMAVRARSRPPRVKMHP